MKWSLVITSIAVTAISWGAYGPILHKGTAAMEGSRMRPFICVGLAYFVIGVLVPWLYIQTSVEPGRWTIVGSFWSLAAGAAGAVGALGIIMAFYYGGTPVFVMPLVFGCAPVVNAFLTMYFARTLGEFRNPLFLAGLILVAVGAVTVLITTPRGSAHHSAPPVQQTAAPSNTPGAT